MSATRPPRPPEVEGIKRPGVLTVGKSIVWSCAGLLRMVPVVWRESGLIGVMRSGAGLLLVLLGVLVAPAILVSSLAGTAWATAERTGVDWLYLLALLVVPLAVFLSAAFLVVAAHALNSLPCRRAYVSPDGRAVVTVVAKRDGSWRIDGYAAAKIGKGMGRELRELLADTLVGEADRQRIPITAGISISVLAKLYMAVLPGLHVDQDRTVPGMIWLRRDPPGGAAMESR